MFFHIIQVSFQLQLVEAFSFMIRHWAIQSRVGFCWDDWMNMSPL